MLSLPRLGLTTPYVKRLNHDDRHHMVGEWRTLFEVLRNSNSDTFQICSAWRGRACVLCDEAKEEA